MVPNSLWHLATRDSFEDVPATISEAIAAFVENMMDQARKELQANERTAWESDYPHGSHQLERKAALIAKLPGLFWSPEAIALARSNLWQPYFVASSCVPHLKLRKTTYEDDLCMCIIVWKHADGQTALSFFNNHVAPETRFGDFVIQGRGQNKGSQYAAGCWGKSFVTSSFRIMFEKGDGTPSKPSRAAEVSFRTGDQLGTFVWLDSSGNELEYASRKDEGEHRGDCLAVAHETIKSVDRQALIKDLSASQRVRGMLPHYGVRDEVVITVINVPGTYDPCALFWATPCIRAQGIPWRISTPFLDFTDPGHKAGLFVRNRAVNLTASLTHVSIDYHGSLTLTPLRHPQRKAVELPTFHHVLSQSIHSVFKSCPISDGEPSIIDLLLKEMMDHDDGLILHAFNPPNTSLARAYKQAFSRLWLQRDPSLPQMTVFYPFTEGFKDRQIITRLQMKACLVSTHLRRILEASGAYPPIKAHIPARLLSCPTTYPEPIAGLSACREVLSVLYPPFVVVKVRNYKYVLPRAVWDAKSNMFLFGLPTACDTHDLSTCFCWVGPAVYAAVKHRNLVTKDKISSQRISWALLRALPIAEGTCALPLGQAQQNEDDEDLYISHPTQAPPLEQVATGDDSTQVSPDNLAPVSLRGITTILKIKYNQILSSICGTTHFAEQTYKALYDTKMRRVRELEKAVSAEGARADKFEARMTVETSRATNAEQHHSTEQIRANELSSRLEEDTKRVIKVEHAKDAKIERLKRRLSEMEADVATVMPAMNAFLHKRRKLVGSAEDEDTEDGGA